MLATSCDSMQLNERGFTGNSINERQQCGGFGQDSGNSWEFSRILETSRDFSRFPEIACNPLAVAGRRSRRKRRRRRRRGGRRRRRRRRRTRRGRTRRRGQISPDLGLSVVFAGPQYSPCATMPAMPPIMLPPPPAGAAAGGGAAAAREGTSARQSDSRKNMRQTRPAK